MKAKRVFASLLAATLIFSAVPTTVFAAEAAKEEGWAADYSVYYYEENGEWKEAKPTKEDVPATCTEPEKIHYHVDVTGGHDEEVVKEGGKPAKGHNWGEPYEVNRVEPTCTKDGSYEEERKCKVCGETEIVSDKPIVLPGGHKEGKPVEVDKYVGDCEKEPGWIEYEVTCEICGEVTQTYREDLPVGHVEGAPKKENEKKATCKEAGSYDEVVYCEKCGAELSRKTVEVPALTEHKWDNGKETKKATCKEDGVKTYTCTVCGETKTETIKATGEHQWGKDEIARDERFRAPGCVTEGEEVHIRKCKVCGEEDKDYTYTVYTEPVGHKWKLVSVKKEQTCEEPGIGDYVCTVCGETKAGKDLPIAPHTPAEAVKENVKEATCTEDEEYDLVVYCEVCKKELSREHKVTEKSAKGHTWGKAVREDKVPFTSCEYETVYDEVVYCDVCGAEKPDSRKEVTIPAKEHQWETIETKDPTCESYGAILKKCSVCGTVKREETKKPLGHDWTEEIKNETATCTEAGTHDVKVYCKRCKKVQSEQKKVASPALGHDFKLTYLPGQAATCETPGKGYGKCSRCGELTEAQDVPALGHDFQKTAAKVTWDATHNGTGYVEYTETCKNDPKHTRKTTVRFTPDDEDVDYKVTHTEKVTKEATCKAEGVLTHESTFEETLPNGKVVSSKDTFNNKIEKADHAWGNPVKEKVKPATCTEDGSYELAVYCKWCGKEDTTKREKLVDKAPGHKEGEEVIENEKNKGSDTLDYTFERVKYCTVCGKELSRVKETVPAKGHKPGKPVKLEGERLEPTCYVPGYQWWAVYCLDDGEELYRYKETLYPIGHMSASRYEYIQEPTCTENGFGVWVRYCTICGEELDRDRNPEVVRATGHSKYFTKTIVTKEPTCTEPGEQVQATFCGVCFEEVQRDEKTTPIPATGHVWDNGVVTKEATPDEKGEMTFTCTVCGETKKEEIDNSALIRKESTIVLNNKLVYYNGKVQAFDATDAKVNGSTGAVTFEYFSDSKCTKKISAPTNCGNYYAKATVAADAEYAAATSSVAKLRVLRVYQGFSVAGKTVTVSAASLKSANQTIPQSKAVTLRKGNDQVKFVKAIWTYNSPITVDKAGNIQLRKGLKAGTYTVKCKAYTPASRNYLRTVKVYTVTIKVK